MTPQHFEAAFSKVMGWIERTLAAHKRSTHTVSSKNFARIPLYFSQAQLPSKGTYWIGEPQVTGPAAVRRAAGVT